MKFDLEKYRELHKKGWSEKMIAGHFNMSILKLRMTKTAFQVLERQHKEN